MIEFITPEWSAPEHIKAFTSTRKGGLSAKPYSGLNVGDHVGDEQSVVNQNRALLSQSAGERFSSSVDPIWLRQEHTTDIASDNCLLDVDKQAFDGFFTEQKRQVCTVMTADCLPVFICDRQGTQVSLVHAGWRGLADGIVEKALSLFSQASSELLVHCGPAISQKHFEVGSEVKEQLGGSGCFYAPNLEREGHYFCDLKGILGERMSKLGVEYTCTHDCTYQNSEQFYSYRREGVTGRMVSLLWID